MHRLFICLLYAGSFLSGEFLLGQEGAVSTDQPASKKEPGERKPGLAEEISKRLRIHAQLRFRYEIADPFAYTLAGGGNRAGTELSDDAVFMRTRLGIDFRPHDMFGGRITLQDSRIWGEEGAANTSANPSLSAGSSTDKVDLHEAYLVINQLFEGTEGEEILTLQVGRQELSFGDQRLVSPLEWSNVARAWDAARVIWTPPGIEDLQVDVFASIIRDTTSTAAGTANLTADTGASGTGVDQIDDNQEFHGIYSNFNFQPFPATKYIAPGDSAEVPLWRKHKIDLYGFWRRLSDDNLFVGEDGATGSVDEYTIGALFKGGITGFDYSAEGVLQFGRYSDDDIQAYGFALTGGYNLPPALRMGLKAARVGVEYTYGSGDADPADGKHETFDPLFPFGHYYQGHQDIFSWKNGQDLALKGTVVLPQMGKLNPIWLEVQYHFFWLSERRDGWYNAGLGLIRRNSSGSANPYVGQELDIHAKYTLLDLSKPQAPWPQKLWLWIGYSHFFPEDYVRETGPAPDRDFAYAQLQMDI